LDGPPGTGFSKIDRNIDYISNEASYMKDAMSFMQQFYNDWPELKGNSMYMSGVGFGGVFASLIALNVHRLNKEKELYGENSYINLKGIFVANGMVDFRFDPSKHTIDMLYQYSIIPKSLYDRYLEKECHIRWEYLWLIASQLEYKPNDECTLIWFDAKNYLGRFINMYDLRDNRKPGSIKG
jgi:carboxypeptidase C (cathepsin A)